jgi:hypothetical protein
VAPILIPYVNEQFMSDEILNNLQFNTHPLELAQNLKIQGDLVVGGTIKNSVGSLYDLQMTYSYGRFGNSGSYCFCSPANEEYKRLPFTSFINPKIIGPNIFTLGDDIITITETSIYKFSVNINFYKQYSLGDPVKLASLIYAISISDNPYVYHHVNIESLNLETVSAGSWYGSGIVFSFVAAITSGQYISIICKQSNALNLATTIKHFPVLEIERIR